METIIALFLGVIILQLYFISVKQQDSLKKLEYMLHELLGNSGKLYYLDTIAPTLLRVEEILKKIEKNKL